MSPSEHEDFSGLAAAAETALRDADRALAQGRTKEISDETIQQLLTAGAKLFAKKTEEEERYFLPFTSRQAATATDVVTTVCEMLRAADLNTFDLSMWFSRPRPEDAP